MAPSVLTGVPDEQLAALLPRELSAARAADITVPSEAGSVYFQIEYVGSGRPGPDGRIEVHYTPRGAATGPGARRRLDVIGLAALAVAGKVSTPPTVAAGFSFRIVGGTPADAANIRVARAFRIAESFKGPVAGFITLSDLRTANPSSVPKDLARRLDTAASSIAAIQVGSGAELPYCTGSLVGERLLLTAAHCATRSAHYQRTRETARPGCGDLAAIFGFSSDDAPGRETVRCETVSYISRENDVAVLRLDRVPEPPRPTLAIAASKPDGRGLVSVLQHPAGRPLRIATACWLRSDGDRSANHDCPTLGGSSGAPLLGPAAGDTGKPEIWAIHRAQNIAFEETLRTISTEIINTCLNQLNQNCLFPILSRGLTDFHTETWGNVAVPGAALRDALVTAGRR